MTSLVWYRDAGTRQWCAWRGDLKYRLARTGYRYRVTLGRGLVGTADDIEAGKLLAYAHFTSNLKETTTTMPIMEIHYDGEGWAALYVDGKLDPDTVGDSYHAEQAALERCGVKIVEDDAFMLGGKDRDSVAKDLLAIAAYRSARDDKIRRAAEKIEQARALLAEAATLDPTGRIDHTMQDHGRPA